jgi:hypothetical protein
VDVTFDFQKNKAASTSRYGPHACKVLEHTSVISRTTVSKPVSGSYSSKAAAVAAPSPGTCGLSPRNDAACPGIQEMNVVNRMPAGNTHNVTVTLHTCSIQQGFET